LPAASLHRSKTSLRGNVIQPGGLLHLNRLEVNGHDLLISQ